MNKWPNKSAVAQKWQSLSHKNQIREHEKIID